MVVIVLVVILILGIVLYILLRVWHYDGGNCYYGRGCIGFRHYIIYLARKLGHYDGCSCFGGGGIGIMYCVV